MPKLLLTKEWHKMAQMVLICR